MNIVKKVVGGKCPICDTGKVFESNGNILLLKTPKMNDTCSHCGHKYETEPGFFFGAMFVSYALIIGELMMFFLLINPFTPSTEMLILSFFIVILLTSFTNFKYSRLIWMYLLT
jgi:uncharacterized protein (DUF983 family)